MNTFPYDSLEAATEAAGGYSTWGAAAGTNGTMVVLAIIGIAISVVSAVLVTVREDALLNHAADRLAEKYN